VAGVPWGIGGGNGEASGRWSGRISGSDTPGWAEDVDKTAAASFTLIDAQAIQHCVRTGSEHADFIFAIERMCIYIGRQIPVGETHHERVCSAQRHVQAAGDRCVDRQHYRNREDINA